MSDKERSAAEQAREGTGADITDNRNSDMAPKGSDELPSRKEGGTDAEQETEAAGPPSRGAGVGGVPGGKAGHGPGTSGSTDSPNPVGTAGNRGPGTTHSAGSDTGRE